MAEAKRNLKRTLIYIDQEAIKRLKYRALEEDISYSELIRRVLDMYLEGEPI